MNKKNIVKRIFQGLSVFILTLPAAVYAQIDNWGISVGGDDWNINIGSGGGGAFGMNNYGLPNGSVLGIVQNILFWFLAVISLVAVIGFVIAGIMYLTAAGDETRAGKAKKALTYSIIGIVVGLSGFVVMQAAFYMLGARSF